MNREERPIRYVRPGPPRNTKPLNAAAMVDRPVTKPTSPCPAIQKSRAFRVRFSDQTPSAPHAARYRRQKRIMRGRSRIGISILLLGCSDAVEILLPKPQA